MSTIQVVLCSALGFIVAQAAFYSFKNFVAWLRRDEIRQPIRRLIPSSVIGAFTRYAAPVGASAIVVTLGVWAVGDYVAAKSARVAAASNTFDTPAALPATDAHGSADEAGDAAVAVKDGPSVQALAQDADPYADADFKVRRRVHAAGTPENLKDKILQRAEARAGADLLREIRQHVRRSQYDCEAADRASRYLKAGLDVWGFATWQLRYFPTDGYTGATLAQCKDIPNVLDSAGLDLKSAVAQQNHP